MCSLSNYCSSNINTNTIFEKFQNCVDFKAYMSPKNNQTSTTDKTIFNQTYSNITSILADVFASIEAGNSSNNDTKNLFLDLLRLVKLAKSHSKTELCFISICDLFKNCEFPLNIEYKTFESDALVAARLASLLTSYTFNEKLDDKVYLTKANIYSMLRLSITEYDNIYDSKITFFRTLNEERFMFHAIKDLNKKELEVKNFNLIMENTRNFQWYFKWLNDKKISNLSLTKWEYKIDDLKAGLDSDKIRMINQQLLANTADLNTIRYESDIQYDCSKGIWNKIVSVPFLNPNGDIRGVVSISISLNKFDLKQCGENPTDEIENENETIFKRSFLISRSRDPFYNTSKCDRATTVCQNQEGKGFVLDSYVCECKPGFYAPKRGENVSKALTCLKCAEGCDTCNDNSPCQTNVSIEFKRVALAINLFCILICSILLILIWYHMSLMALKTSSPKMLFMVLIGAIVSYSEIIPMYFQPNRWTCTTAQVFQLIGFLLAYGALVLKTWRECKLFYVRSVKTVKITDTSLMKRLGVIMLVGLSYLAAWALQKDHPRQEVPPALDPLGLKYETCTITEWNFISMAIQLAILLWGAVLSVQVRRASIAFKETKLITWAIFNEGVVCLAVISITVLLKNTKVSCYVPFTLNFVRIHLTITVMLLLLFSYKVYKIFLSRKKPFQSTQSSGIINNFAVSGKDGELKSTTASETETEKERELRIEILRLYRQIEEMRSLSMRIANPHLITKKSKFGYPTKKFKAKKTNFEAASKFENEQTVNPPAESIALLTPTDSSLLKKKTLIVIEEDSKSFTK